MAIYEITLRASLLAQNIINVFHYVSSGTIGETPSALQLLTALGFIPAGEPPVFPEDTLFEAIRSLVSDSVHFTEVEARNLYSNTDFYLAGYSPTANGTTSGIDQSPLVSYGLRSNRVRTDIRRGFKRFGGVVEEATTNGGIIVTPFTTALELVATRMGEVVDGVGIDSYSPAVLSFEKYTTPSDKFAYRPYATEADQLDHAAFPVTWAGYSQVRSQTSRQYGRGQ